MRDRCGEVKDRFAKYKMKSADETGYFLDLSSTMAKGLGSIRLIEFKNRLAFCGGIYEKSMQERGCDPHRFSSQFHLIFRDSTERLGADKNLNGKGEWQKRRELN